MARLVKRTPHGSYELTKGEEAGKLYRYDDAGQRHEAAGAFPAIRSF